MNPEKTKYMLMLCYQKVGQKLNIKIKNTSFQYVAKFKYLGTLKDQNCMHEGINSKINSENACYYSSQSLL
jgi:hypothetical protein